MRRARTSWMVLAALVAAPALAQTAPQKSPLAASHASSPAISPPAGKAVARVNGVTLGEQDLQREMQRIFPYAGIHGRRIEGGFPPEVRQQALDQIVFEELLHQEARRRKLVVPTTMFRDILQQANARFPSRPDYESYARKEYGSVAAFENQLRRGLLIAMLTEQEITRKAAVSDAQTRQLYNNNKKRFLKPPSIWVQSITINIPENATPTQRAEARKRAEQVLPLARGARSYEQFGQLAEKYSQDDWRVMMGDHRWIHRGRMPEAVERVAFGMKTGEISGIIESPSAFVIVRINGAQPQTQIPYAQVAESLRKDLQQATLDARRKQLSVELRKLFKVEVL